MPIKRIASSPETKRLITTFGTFFGSVVSGQLFRLNLSYWGIGWIIFCVLLVYSATRPGRYDKQALEAALQAFFNAMRFDGDTDVRCSIYVPIKKRGDEEYLQQITDYMPGNRPTSKELLNSRKGIVGKAYRTKKVLAERLIDDNINSLEVFVEYMLNWGFTDAEARNLNRDRRSYLAYPILDEDRKCVGVLYCDSNDVSSFSDAGRPEQVETFIPFFRQLLKLKGA